MNSGQLYRLNVFDESAKKGGEKMMVKILYCAGILLLGLLSVKDFSEKIIRVKRRTIQYNFCMVLFILINIIIYTGICGVAMKVDMLQLLFGNGTLSDVTDKSLWPIVIAFAYFGLGSASIPMGNKTISFYGTVLGLFQGMFSLKGIDIDPIKEKISRLQKETEQLKRAVNEFADSGRAKGWKILKDQWKDMNEDNKILDEYVDGLREALKNFEADDISAEAKVKKMSAWFDNRISKISQKINTKIRNHIVKLVIANDKNQEALENILSRIGLSIPDYVSEKESKAPFCRAALFSLFAGIILGALSPIFLVSDPGIPVGYHMLIWGLGIGLFGLTFSWIAYLDEKKVYWALALGGVAGIIGQLTIKVMQIALGTIDKSWGFLLGWWPQLSVGLLYGAFLGITIHLFRYSVRTLISKCYLCYIVFAMTSAISFVIIGWVLGLVTLDQPNSIIFFAIIGATVAIKVAVITNAFENREVSL